MSIRKVSDLEALHFDDSQHSAEDISCSLLEFSVPSHDARGHSFKSMMAEYRDVRQDIKNSIVNAPITFEYPVTFEETAFFHKGIHMSGDLFVNKDSPGWEDTTIEMYAGDITLCAANTMRLYSGNEIQLSAPTVTVGANSLTLKPFNKNGKFMEATAGGTGDLAVRFGAPVSCEALSCATPVSSDLARAATVEYVNSCIDALREELSSEPEEPGEFKLEEMNLYTSADIPHVKYMLEKLYSYTEPEYDDDGNEIGASVRRFAEYDIKTIPTKDADSDDSKDKYISFPNLLQKETTSVIAMESTNASSSTLKAQKIKTTTLTLIPLGEKDSVLASWVGGLDLKGVAKTEAASIRVFGEVVAVENLNQYVVMDAKFYREPGQPGGPASFQFPAYSAPAGQTAEGLYVYNKAGNEYQIELPVNSGKAGYYSFATPWFQMCPEADIGRAAKSGSRIFMMFDGRLATDLGKKSNVDMYIVYGNLSAATDEVKEYPARHVAANAYKGTGAPFMETLQPMKFVKGNPKADPQIPDKEERCAPLEADNKYYVVKKDQSTSEQRYSYWQRYLWNYKKIGTGSSDCGHWYSGTADADNPFGGTIETNVKKKINHAGSSSYKKIGREQVNASAGAVFQFQKTLTVSKSLFKKGLSYARIVFTTSSTNGGLMSIPVDQILKVKVCSFVP